MKRKYISAALAAVLFVLPASAFALSDLEKSENENAALRIELEKYKGEEQKYKDGLVRLEAEYQKKSAELDAAAAAKDKETAEYKARAEKAEAEKAAVQKAANEKAAQIQKANAAKTQADAKKIQELQKQVNELQKKNSELVKADEARAAKEKALASQLEELQKSAEGEGIQTKASASEEAAPAPDKVKEKIASLEAAVEDLSMQLEECSSLLEGCKDRVREQQMTIDHFTEQQKRVLKEELKGEMEAGHVRMSESPDKSKILLNLDNRISFDSGSAVLKKRAVKVLKKISGVLKNYPENMIVIEGHTDSDRITRGRFSDNMELSEARAKAVYAFLLSSTGLDESRFTVRGCGDAKPAAENDTPEHKALNRRVDIIITPAESVHERPDEFGGFQTERPLGLPENPDEY